MTTLFAGGGLALVTPHWYASRDGDPEALNLYLRHYSRRDYKDGRRRRLFVGPGQKTVLVTADGRALFVWRKFRSMDGQSGVCCSIFRREGGPRASVLVTEAMAVAWKRWPGERLYTYVNPKKVRSSNPGCCFKKCGWRVCGRTKGGLVILEVKPLWRVG